MLRVDVAGSMGEDDRERSHREAAKNVANGIDACPCGVNVLEDEDLPVEMLRVGNNAANDTYTKRCKESGLKIHPARFPAALPEFFFKLLTDDGDYVLDPFAGSNTTGAVAESLGLRWIGLRGRTHPPMLTVAEAVERAARVPGRPVVAADVADNPGGGFPGDGTVVLAELVARGVTDCAFATIWCA